MTTPTLTASGRHRRLGRSLGFCIPLLMLTVVALALAWLNRSPWWGWAFVVTELVIIGATARWWVRGHALRQVGTWLLAGTLVCATAVFAYPAPQPGVAGGEDRSPTEPVHTTEGPVTGVYNDTRTVEVFAGIPYAQAPVGALRWRAPEPLEPRTNVFAAYHGAEVVYAFENLEADSDAEYTDADYLLRNQMSTYWVNFVRTGDPNAPGLPTWPTFSQAPNHTMEFDGGSEVTLHPRQDEVDFWMNYDGPIP